MNLNEIIERLERLGAFMVEDLPNSDCIVADASDIGVELEELAAQLWALLQGDPVPDIG